MRLSFKHLKNYSVETASGTKLGHVADIVFEIEGQLIAQYIVNSSFMSSKEYTVSRDQIVRFEDKKIIVDDNVSKEKTTDKAQRKNNISSAEPVAMRSKS